MSDLLKKVLYCLDGRRCDLADGNNGDADEWVRHIDSAYSDYVDSGECADGWISVDTPPDRMQCCDIWIESPDGEEGRVCNCWYIQDEERWFMRGMADYISGKYVTHYRHAPPAPTK